MEFNCPYCNGKIIINESDINCGIFCHAVYKSNLEPINPHSSKEECEKLLKEKSIFGCAGPFQIKKENDKFKIEKCGFI